MIDESHPELIGKMRFRSEIWVILLRRAEVFKIEVCKENKILTLATTAAMFNAISVLSMDILSITVECIFRIMVVTVAVAEAGAAAVAGL